MLKSYTCYETQSYSNQTQYFIPIILGRFSSPTGNYPLQLLSETLSTYLMALSLVVIFQVTFREIQIFEVWQAGTSTYNFGESNPPG